MAVQNPVVPKEHNADVQQPAFIKAVASAELAFMNAYGASKPDARNVWVRESMLAMQAVKNSDDLQKCTMESIKTAVVNIALTGATLNPALKEADLIARKGKACLDFRYGGLIRIAVDAGAVLSMNAYVVYDCDEFDYDLGKNPPVKYKPSMNPPFDPEKVARDPKLFWDHVVCAICRSVLPSGIVDWQVLPKWKLLKVRETSMSKNSSYSPWTNWPEEMIRKTVIKYASKTLKGYSKNDRLERAVQLQNDIDGLDVNEPKGRDPGAELEKRLGVAASTQELPPPPTGEATSEPQPDNPANVSGEGLTGAVKHEEVLPDGSKSITTGISKITDRVGKGPHRVFDGAGMAYNTFSDSLKKVAAEAQEAGLQAKIRYKTSSFGLDIVSIDKIEPRAPGEDG